MKKLLLFFGLICMINLTFAQQMTTVHLNGHDIQTNVRSVNISADNVQFWVGTGSNSTLVCIGWDDDDAGYTPTVVVWGVHWNGSITLQNALDSIVAYDSRFTYAISGGFVNSVDYNDPAAGIHLSPSFGWNCNSYGSAYGSTTLTSTWLRISETCSDYNFSTVNNLIYASDPNAPVTTDPVDAALAFSDILYWVGSGSDSAEFIVNFGQPDTAFAWGFLFNGTTTAQAMVDAIAAADPRFWTEGSPSGSGDIHFVLSNGDTLGLSPVDPNVGYNFWWTNLNGVSAGSGAASTLHNGDVFKYGDINAAIGWDFQYGYYMEEAWIKTPTPVTPPAAPVVEDATITANDIIYWVGTGSDSAIFVLNIDTTSVAWGYRFNAADEPTVDDMISAIDAADPRLAYAISWETFDYTFYYVNYPLKLIGDDYRFKVNGTLASALDEFEDYDLADNMIVVVSNLAGDTWNTPITPATVATMPVDATISADEILYWVGEGSNEAVIAINWGVPDTALAWGLRFNGSLTVTSALQALVAAENRLTTDAAMSTFNYTDGATNLSFQNVSGNYMQFILNGNPQAGLNSAVNDGAFLKVGESAYGIGYDSTAYAGMWFPTGVTWPTEIHPVSVPDTTPVNPDPEDATIDPSEITYWVGSGNTEVIFVGNWCVPEVALAWGVRFNGNTTTVEAVMDSIAAYDSRFGYSGGGDIIYDVTYQDANYNLVMTQPSTGYIMYNVNGVMAGFGYQSMNVQQGDLIKVGNIDCATMTGDPADWTTWGYAWQTQIVPVSAPAGPVDPTPEEATINFNDILFWVGEGTNEAVMAVNWADTALAWGYRWNGTATVEDMMNHIAAADPRFSFTGTGVVSDINYIDTAAGMTTPLGITPGNWWSSTNNGFMDAGMGQALSNGDLEKWADPAAGIVVDSIYYDGWGWSYTYVYPMTIHPVTVPDTTGGSGTDTIPDHGPFCGAVGTDGCNAIAVNDNQFVAWATGVTVTRGPQNITNPTGPLADYGVESNVIGPATTNNTQDVVSLGDGGSAVVTFERPIRNGEGPDFAVFENSFNDSFLELAFVEVSSDGEHFVRFPATSLTPTDEQVSGAVGGVDPTFINNLAGKFRIGYGTPFDLEELAGNPDIDIDSIVYVRIVDAIGTIDPQYATYDAYGHIVNDPWPTPYNTGGFDLTGVGVIHQKPLGVENHDVTRITVYPNPCNDRIYVNLDEVQKVELYNINGQLLEMIQPDDTHFTIDMQRYPAGMYLLKVGTGVQKIMKR